MNLLKLEGKRGGGGQEKEGKRDLTKGGMEGKDGNRAFVTGKGEKV